MQRIGRYEIVEEIGRGGFGHVYRARDPVMKRDIALKVMNGSNDPELLARFRNEATSAGNLHHKNIITIYDFGQENGVPYIVMEYLRGLDLQKVRDRDVALSLLEKVRILSQVAEGLQVAHDQGIIHRDIKPANIMLLEDGNVKIMDFGIARLNREDATLHTRTGVVIGTLQYIAPEQFEGHAADALTDLWSFGVIAYQLLSGRNPFDALDTAQVLYRITSLQIPDVRQLSPDVPEELAAVVYRLLERDRRARYQGFEDVRIDLHPILDGLELQDADRLTDQARVVAAKGELRSAHQLVRSVLERHPSHADARRLRDQIVSQIRSQESRQEFDQLLKKGDGQLAERRFPEAIASFEQACRIEPGSSTAGHRLERARELAARAAKIDGKLNEAAAALAGGNSREAERVVSGILATDPDHDGARRLHARIQQQISDQENARRAEAILNGRMLASARRYDEALAALRAFSEDAGIRKVIEEIRQESLTYANEARIENALRAADADLRQGRYAEARKILEPLAAEFPWHAEVRELLATASAGERAAKRPDPATGAAGAVPDRQRIIAQALQLSGDRENEGRLTEAVHILEVALSRYPDARELSSERARLLALSAAPPPVPERAAPPSPAPPTAAAAPQGSGSVRRLALWGGIALLAAIGAVVFWPRHSSETGHNAQLQPPPASGAPAPASQTAPPPAARSELPRPLEAPRQPAESRPPLSSAAPVRVDYRQGDPAPRPVVIPFPRELSGIEVDRGNTWLRASAAGSRASVSVDPARLGPGRYAGQVTVVAGQERAQVSVSLIVSAAPAPVAAKAEPASPARADTPPPAPPAQPAQKAEPLKPVLYLGARRGTCVWNGNLGAGARLALTASGVEGGGGQMSGAPLPPVEVAVEEISPAELKAEPAGAGRVVVTNTSSSPIASIRLRWRIK